MLVSQPPYTFPQPVYQVPQHVNASQPVYQVPQPIYNAPQPVYAPQPNYNAPVVYTTQPLAQSASGGDNLTGQDDVW